MVVPFQALNDPWTGPFSVSFPNAPQISRIQSSARLVDNLFLSAEELRSMLGILYHFGH